MNVWQVQIVLLGFFDPLLWAHSHPIGFGWAIPQKLGILGKSRFYQKKFPPTSYLQVLKK